MAERSRNHYIPRVLLNRFHSWKDEDRKKYKIWSFIDKSKFIEVSTKDVAVKKKLYGDTDELERALNEKEGRWAEVLRDISKGIEPENFVRDLSELAWLQSWRTHSIRVRFSNVIETFLAEMNNSIGSRLFNEAFEKRAYTDGLAMAYNLSNIEFLNLLEKIWPIGLNDYIRLYIWAQIKDGAPQMHIRNMLQFISAQDIINSITRDGMNKSLTDVVDLCDVPSAWYLPNWIIWKFDNENLILGDGVVLSSKYKGQLGPLRDAESWDWIVLPIDPHNCLVGYKTEEPKKISAASINLASARSSVATIFSSINNAEIKDLTKLIGSNIELIPEEELAVILGKMWVVS